MGLNKPGGPQAGLSQVRQGADRLATGSRQVAGGVDELVDQVKLMSAGLDEASAFLLTMKHNASDPAMAGFNIPAEVLDLEAFQKASKLFVSPDGQSARYLVQTKLNPFSLEAMDQVNAILIWPAAPSRTPRRPTRRSRWAAFRRAGGTPATTTSTTSGFIIAVTMVAVLGDPGFCCYGRS